MATINQWSAGFSFVTLLLIAGLYPNLNAVDSTCSMYAMIWNKSSIQNGINGYYMANQYYCVWTANRTEWEINMTVEHEICHDLVRQEYNHFCLGEEVKE